MSREPSYQTATYGGREFLLVPTSEGSDGFRRQGSHTNLLRFDDPAIRDIPFNVRRIVSFDDDPTLPTLTFRYFVLTLLFVIPGAFLSQMSHYRTNAAPYSIFFVQICANYLGQWMARILPPRQVNIPFTSWGFNLNPGPFSVKEHVLITISAASGATYNLAFMPVSIASLYFNETINPAIAIFFMWSVVVTGYSFAAISRQFLLYDPQYPWFQASVLPLNLQIRLN